MWGGTLLLMVRWVKVEKKAGGKKAPITYNICAIIVIFHNSPF